MVIVEIIAVAGLILFNGILAMAEIAIISSRKTKLQELSRKGDLKAATALKLAKTPNSFLSTIQIGITLVSILSGAFGGATIAEQLSSYLADIPSLEPYSNVLGIGIVVIIIGYFTLVFGEIVPKRLGMTNPEKISIKVARPIDFLSRLFHPVVRFLGFSTNIVLSLFGIKPSKGTPVTEEEIKVLIEQGAREGILKKVETEIVERVFMLDDRRINSLMTPANRVVWINIDDADKEISDTILNSHFSRFPVCNGTLDKVLGIVHLKSLFSIGCDIKASRLRSILQQPLFVTEGMRALKVMTMFKESGVHTAIVVDEYGVVQGIVTLNDILEVVIGELHPANEPRMEPEAVQREDGSWLIDGDFTIVEFKELFQIERMPEEDKNLYLTIAGFVTLQFGDIPRTSAHFLWDGFRFEVVDTDGRKIDKVLVTPLKLNS
ncbi:MAG: hypothetical protein DKM50_13485 [Candidatus Margulisiibacteriota bacterium]|nr:MAG: hypothetical protein A2X43_10635 [Candidatus Margulisbacteria bacterium GWD2_39_127]OGI04463.1 MAG: hypothetical protein A2X42_04130 [Candidatus Margulisbacteria bacterium GWF2_38_17]OGI07173.1 MAG: hypothetical protein A2X41_06200 [Candidatus Margulisbacteria bacterium GWE2_39_32]PZM77275.1 MAG: hypothetical protein DKM50_13485 [Candidatus Margulisiibacteriota bacterium]HAR64386.1 hypothetical protein [Candidatus Margulisiibacteriota bacterium]